MHKLTQLERLDLGNNEFSELVRNAGFGGETSGGFLGYSVLGALNFYWEGFVG